MPWLLAILAPALTLGAPGDGLAITKLGVRLTPGHATVTLTVATAEAPREAQLAITLPPGAQLVGAALTLGASERMTASFTDAATARAEYAARRETVRDPLLVEAAGDGYAVRAFPILPDEPARIELVLALGTLESLVIDPAGQRIETFEARSEQRTVRRALTAPLRLKLPPAIPAPLAAPVRAVAGDVALYAGPPPRVPLPSYAHGDSVGKREIRTALKRARPRLTYCYERVTQFRGGEEGTAVLHFTVAPDGSIAAATVDGELSDERVTSCLRDVALTWRFPPGDTTVFVNYPLHFLLN